MMRIVRTSDPDTSLTMQKLVNRTAAERGIEPRVREILDAVRTDGDAALIEFTSRYDGVERERYRLRVSDSEIGEAKTAVSRQGREAITEAARRIEAFHTQEVPSSWEIEAEPGVRIAQRVRALDSVGVYVPGGEAIYPSTVLMNTIPAAVAGVPRVALATPPNPAGRVDPHVLCAAAYCGVSEVYCVGGAQAIGAFAYGTETIPSVDKIVGPGNAYVNAAKRLVFGDVGIDALAGPSEVVVLADGTGDPALVAADLLSQAEHDRLATVVLVTPSAPLAEAVKTEIERQVRTLERADVIKTALAERGALIVAGSLDEGIEIANRLAPEHLELIVDAAEEVLPRLRNAGTILVGQNTPVAFCDYGAGPTHVLPTGGTARFASPLGVADFVVRTNVLTMAPGAGERLADALLPLAEMERFTAHAAAMRARKESADG
jgi:histidinol dehydrogenase